MTPVSSETLHASCVAIGEQAILISGRSGSGKSDLALRLIDRGAALVSDDYTIVRRAGSTLIASAPFNIASRIEVRGLGIVAMPHRDDLAIMMMVRTELDVARFPDDAVTATLLGCSIPLMTIAPFEPSAPIKVEIFLSRLGQTQ